MRRSSLSKSYTLSFFSPLSRSLPLFGLSESPSCLLARFCTLCIAWIEVHIGQTAIARCATILFTSSHRPPHTKQIDRQVLLLSNNYLYNLPSRRTYLSPVNFDPTLRIPRAEESKNLVRSTWVCPTRLTSVSTNLITSSLSASSAQLQLIY